MAKIASKGTLLKMEISSVFTTIAQVYELNAPPGDVQTFNSTDLAGGVGMTHAVTGYVDTGELTASLFFDPTAATVKAMTAKITTPAENNFKVVWSDGSATEWGFAGIIRSLGPKATLQDALKADVRIQVSGLVTYPT